MTTQDFSQEAFDYQRVEQAIQFLEENFKEQPDLDEIASSVNLSKYHFQRLFKRWVGISPTQFLQFLTLDYTKQQLAEGHSVLDAAYEAGLSGPGRLHDLFMTFEAMTPGEYKKMGGGLRVEYGFHQTPFGECLLAKTERGICHLSFVDQKKYDEAFIQLQSNWAQAIFNEQPQKTQTLVDRIFVSEHIKAPRPFHLLLKGTNFQVNVWKALLSIPGGTLVSYQNVAGYLGKPSATRAVAHAVAINPVAYLIPCHRVITKEGKIHRYRWGSARKKAIVGWEAANKMHYIAEA